ncbi:MAG: M60 family metallopeptidase [Alloprevotella sp.]|nr:M60 family metallopeptidase [Alloprevotella sp.]
MKTLYQYISGALVALAGLMAPAQVEAQVILPDGALPMLVTGHHQTVGYAARTFQLPLTGNVDATYACDADWVTITRGGTGLYVSVSTNLLSVPREAHITLTNAEKGLTQTFTVEQTCYVYGEDIPEDPSIKPTSVTANNSHSGEGPNLTLDGDYGTFWHTAWGSNNKFTVSETNPAVLTYTFSNVDHIDYINYVPRQDGEPNGNFLKFELLVKCVGDSDYRLHGTYEWPSNAAPKTIEFEGGLQKPVNIQFRVLQGAGDFACCAEMEFRLKTGVMDEYEIFGDDLYTTLRPGTTLAEIEALTNPLVRTLAYQIFNGNYSTEYRAASYKCYNSPGYYSDQWKAPGKYYDQIAGVTGIHIEKGKHVVLVRDIPDDISVQLKVVAWYVGKDGSNFDGGNPNTTTFNLRNGLNVIDYTYDWPGLAYICYYSYGNSANYQPIRVHFINGVVNGYLSPDKTNDEMHKLTANATNVCMDVLGSKVHSIWTSQGLNSYCKSTSGTIGYRQYMNVMDSLVMWEQRLLGFEKYNRLPDLRTMAYTNYTYYMFQGGFGVSFHHNQESRVLNCATIVYNDEDAIWGLSHEWGHQHQMNPYFCWAGMAEVTNNMNSYYNIMHMGYPNYRDRDQWKTAAGYFMNDNKYGSGTQTSGYRTSAKANSSDFDWNQKLKTFCNSMGNGVITAYADNPRTALAHQESSMESLDISLGAFVKLYCYFRDNGFPEVAEDWYEALRQNDNDNGSQIEKQGGVDKYELLASSQNGWSDKWTKFKRDYPQSVWTRNNYVEPSKGWWMNSAPFILNYIRKVSRITGYNLVPYFEKWGFIRCVAMRIGDYGDKWYVLTDDMYDEFIADMDALVQSGELKVMPAGMVEEISWAEDKLFARPRFPN